MPGRTGRGGREPVSPGQSTRAARGPAHHPVATLAVVPPTLDSALLTGWVRAATRALERHRAEIDRINVFPVPDGDTGTNLLLTMRSAAEAVPPPTDARQSS